MATTDETNKMFCLTQNVDFQMLISSAADARREHTPMEKLSTYICFKL